MRLVIILYILTLSLGSFAQNEKLISVRNQFYKATQSSSDAETFYEKMEQQSETNAVMLGYKAMAELMLSKHAYSPYTKVKHFNLGKDKLEKSIQMSPQNVELRYLRYATQSNVPSVLNYNDNLVEDKKILLDFIKSGSNDADLEKRIRAFFKSTYGLSKDEKLKASL